MQEKVEWLVVPIIVVFAFVVGLLNAVFLGIAMSTFIFVATFFRSGEYDQGHQYSQRTSLGISHLLLLTKVS